MATGGIVVPNTALDTLRAGKVALGVGVRFARTIDIAKAMKVAGYDWLFIDQEHATTPEDVVVQIRDAAGSERELVRATVADTEAELVRDEIEFDVERAPVATWHGRGGEPAWRDV